MTGFAHPNRTRKSMMNPIGSMWRAGLSDSRPVAFGSGSPNLVDTSAWAYSCMVSATTIPGRRYSASTRYCFSMSSMMFDPFSFACAYLAFAKLSRSVTIRLKLPAYLESAQK